MRNLCIILGIFLAVGTGRIFAQDQPDPVPAEPVAEPAPAVPETAPPKTIVVVEKKGPPKLRSSRDTSPVTVTWKNSGTRPVVLQRVDFEGVEVAIENGRLLPGTTLETQTAVGNVFAVHYAENLKGRKINYVIPEGDYSSSNPNEVQADQVIEVSTAQEKDYRCDFRVDLAPVPPRYRFVCASMEFTGYGTLWEQHELENRKWTLRDYLVEVRDPSTPGQGKVLRNLTTKETFRLNNDNTAFLIPEGGDPQELMGNWYERR